MARSEGGIGDRLSARALIARRGEQPTIADSAQLLGQLPIFSGVPKRHLRQIARLAKFPRFEPGDMIVQAGEPGDSFYLILDGRARVVGKPRSRTLGPGDFFGEMALLDGQPRSATITALSELHAIKLARGPFAKVLKKEPGVAMAIMEELAGRVRRLEKAAAV